MALPSVESPSKLLNAKARPRDDPPEASDQPLIKATRNLPELHINENCSQEHQLPLFEIRQIPGKGRGLVACRKILRDELIVQERPLLTIPESICRSKTSAELEAYIAARLACMEESFQDQFLSLTTGNRRKKYPLLARYKSNSWDHEPPGKPPSSFVSATACLVNHDCQANSRLKRPWDLETVWLRAIRRIEPGEEITVDYVGGYLPAERQDLLLNNWGIACKCKRCCSISAESSDGSESDAASEPEQETESEDVGG